MEYLAFLSVAGIVAAVSVALSVLGMTICRLFRWQWILQQGPGLNAVVGLSTALLYLEVWNLFFPVNHASVAVLGSAVLVAAIWLWRTVAAVARDWIRVSNLLVASLLLFLLFTVSWFGLGPFEHNHYDTGLYYLNAIQWARDFPVVPGLANLHSRLGFNQSLFLFVAFLTKVSNLGLGRACQVVNPIVVFVSGWAVLDRLKLNLTQPKARRLRLYAVLLLCPLFFLATHIWMSAPTSDISAAAFALPGAVAAFCCLEAIFEKNRSEAINWLLLLAMLGSTIMKLKLSYAVLGGAAVGVAAFAFVFIWRREFLRVWIRAAVLAAIMVIPWAVRGVVLSGYAFYPSTLIRFHTDWAIPSKQANSDRDWIYSWAKFPDKTPQEVLGNNAWFGPWVERNAKDSENVFLFLLMTAGLLSAFLSAIFPANREQRLLAILLMVPSTVALIFWFKTAPDPRFAYGTLLLFGVNGFYAAIAVLSDLSMIRAGICTCLFTLAYLSPIFKNQWPYINVLEKNFPQGFPKVQLDFHITKSGLQVGVPRRIQIWNAGLVVTPYFNPNLALRGHGLRDGFRRQQPNHQ